MPAAVPEFSARQATRLKVRLIAYRALASRSASPLSLMALIQQIADSDAAHPWLRDTVDAPENALVEPDENILRTERADKGAPMTTNVLQKWFSGELVTRGRGPARMRVRHFTTPSPSNLMAIFAFLREKGFVTDTDLREDPWPYAVIATIFRDYHLPQNASAAAGGASGALGEFYTSIEANRDVTIRRLSITERGIGPAVAVEERVMVFARTALTTSSSATTIDLHRPAMVTILTGWGFALGSHLSIYTRGQHEAQPQWNEYKSIKSEQEEDGSITLELAVISNYPAKASTLTHEMATNSPAAFIAQIMARLKAQDTRVQGPRIKLLRPANLPATDAETYELLAGCFSLKAPSRLSWERFALLTSIVANINARDPHSGGTILHIASRTLNRSAIKALIKRKDLDVLALDHEGYFASQWALETDSRSPIGHLLLKKEIAAAKSQERNYAAEISRVPITPAI
jgi:hypothetical protein